MHTITAVKKIVRILLVLFILCTNLHPIDTIFASEFNFYNHNTKSKVNYKDKQITYVYNDREIQLDYPGIILNGTALADYEDLFVKELELSATITDKTITLSDGETELILTVGSKTVKLNGNSQKMSVAPAKLEFNDGTIKYYVPTRFVAETFGFNYVYDSKNSKVILTKTITIQINKKNVIYNDAFYSLYYGNEPILSDSLIINYKDTVYAPAKLLADALDCQYAEEEKIFLSKEKITLQLENGSYSVLANDIPIDLGAAPINISDQIYIPLEASFKLLGFNVEFSEKNYTYEITKTDYTGIPELHPDLKQYYNKITVELEQKPITTYFTWNSKTNTNINGFKNLTKVKAYSINNADVLELYGITKDDVYDYIDTRALIFELDSVASNMETKFYADFEAPHLNYVFLTTINQHTKIFMMIPKEDEWVFEETEECLKIYFMPKELKINDLRIYEEKIIKNIPEKNENIYPENQLIVSFPESVDMSKIQIHDNYFDKNIQINLPGDLSQYFLDNAPINPYDFISDVEILYNSEENQTTLTCKTQHICGFEAIFKDTYIAIRMGKPSEIYNKILVLDAGHGGKDPGAVNNDIYEKDLNLCILNCTMELFDNSDIKVYYTRTNDEFLSLQQRVRFTKEVTADLFVSLHMNASELKNVSGTEVYYSGSNNKATYYGLTSKKIAQTLANNLHLAMDSKLRGVIKNNYYVIEYNSVPAALIELGFISNTEECEKLSDKSYQQKAAQAIYDSIIEIFSTYPTGR